MAAVTTQPPDALAPVPANPSPPIHVVDHALSRIDGIGTNHESGALPIARPPPPPAKHPVPTVGSASPRPPLNAGPPTVTAQPRFISQRPSQPPLNESGLGNRLPTTHNGKVAIVDPPRQGGRRSSGGSSPPTSFASPGREHHRDTKFGEDFSRLTHGVHQSVPAAVRRVVRDNWEKALLGTEFHQAFIMNATIHHANGMIVKRSIKDFGHKMITEAKNEVVGHLSAKDLDDVADLILEKASDNFLDKALERRLGTIDARSLINALARAERLGYENNDAMDQNPDSTPMPEPFPSSTPQAPVRYQQQRHQPQTAQPAQPAQPVHRPHTVQPEPQLASRPAPTRNLQCSLCWRRFATVAPFEYHVKKQVCTKQPPTAAGFDFSCEHCGAGFITNVGQQYHHANKVCGDHGTASATPKGDVVMSNSPIASPGPNAAGSYSAAQSSPSLPTPTGTKALQQYTPASKPGKTPSSGPTAYLADPYAHLNAETKSKLDEELLAAENSFAPRFRAAEAIADPTERKLRLEGLQNSFSTRQSIVRKRYGVRLRQRRTKAEIDSERQRIAAWGDTPSAKRQRIDSGTDETPTWSRTQYPASPNPPVASSAPSPAMAPPVIGASPSSRLSVANMKSSGLGGAGATAAASDPTMVASQPDQAAAPRSPAPARSLSSMQRSGYRISTHSSRRSASPEQSPEPQDKQALHSAGPSTIDEKKQIPVQAQPRNGSAAEPLLLEDDSTSSDGSDEETPAHGHPQQIGSGTPHQN